MRTGLLAALREDLRLNYKMETRQWVHHTRYSSALLANGGVLSPALAYTCPMVVGRQVNIVLLGKTGRMAWKQSQIVNDTRRAMRFRYGIWVQRHRSISQCFCVCPLSVFYILIINFVKYISVRSLNLRKIIFKSWFYKSKILENTRAVTNGQIRWLKGIINSITTVRKATKTRGPGREYH